MISPALHPHSNFMNISPFDICVFLAKFVKLILTSFLNMFNSIFSSSGLASSNYAGCISENCDNAESGRLNSVVKLVISSLGW